MKELRGLLIAGGACVAAMFLFVIMLVGGHTERERANSPQEVAVETSDQMVPRCAVAARAEMEALHAAYYGGNPCENEPLHPPRHTQLRMPFMSCGGSYHVKETRDAALPAVSILARNHAIEIRPENCVDLPRRLR